MTATNKRLLISESRSDSNWCTPCRGKPDQHTTCFPHSVCVWSKIIRISHSQRIATPRRSPTALDRVTAPEKKGSQHNPQHAGWSICEFVPSFSPEPTNGVVEKAKHLSTAGYRVCWSHKQQHTIGTFNTCSWGPTHRSLTNLGGGYRIEGADFPHTTPRPSQPVVFTFHIRAPPGLQFIQVLPSKPEFGD
jgi:hypothetical protein